MKYPSLRFLFLTSVALVASSAESQTTNSVPFQFFSIWKDSGPSLRLRCYLTNETDDDWFVYVDDMGKIIPDFDALPEDVAAAKDGDIHFDFKEEDFIPTNVFWVQSLYPARRGTRVGPNDFRDQWSWNIAATQGKKSRGTISVRAVNWNRWLATFNGSVANGRESANDDLRWRLGWAGTNLVLSVENVSSNPCLLHVNPEGVNGNPSFGDDDPRSFGPFLLFADVQIGPPPNLWQISRTGTPIPRGIYRVLHGLPAPENARTHSFFFGAARPKRAPAPGTVVQCKMNFFPFVIYPFSAPGETNRTIESCQRGLHMTLSTNITVRVE